MLFSSTAFAPPNLGFAAAAGAIHGGFSGLGAWGQLGGWPWFGGAQPSLGQGGALRWHSSGSQRGGGGSGDESGPSAQQSREPDEFSHVSVMLQEVLEMLQPAPGKLIFDGTLGGGGHSAAFLQAGARVVAMDQDDEALAYATKRLSVFADRFCALKGNFRDFPKVLAEAGIEGLDGMLVDLGVSSWQLDCAQRGFSFNKDGPLDMRMDQASALTAADIVNDWDAEDLERMLRDNAQEPAARRIARAIVRGRPYRTTLQLASQVARVCSRHGRRHPATLTFQALRLEVNGELPALREFLQQAPRWLKPGGRLAVISFHSLEDRLVKQAFAHASSPWLDQPNWPQPRPNPDCCLSLLCRKPLEPSEQEIGLNPRARSARLRGAQKLPPS